MADVTRIRATISLNAESMRRGLRQASQSASAAGRRISSTLRDAAERSRRAFTGMARGIGRSLTGLSGLLAGAGLVAGFRSLASEIDRVAKSARTLGIGVAELQALEDAAAKSGVEAGALNSTLQAFQRRTAQAAQGTGELAIVLGQMGIDAQAFAELPLQERLGVFADAMNELGSRTEQSQAAAAAFSRQGIQLLPLLDAGSEGIRQMGADFAATGAALTDEGAAGVETFNDRMQDLQTSLKALVQELVVELGPALTDIASLVTDIIGPINEVRKALVERLSDAFLTTTITIRRLWNDLVAGFLDGLAKLSARSATTIGAVLGADAGAAALNRATDLERAAAGFRRDADQARQELEVLRSQGGGGGGGTPSGSPAAGEPAPPLASVGRVTLDSLRGRAPAMPPRAAAGGGGGLDIGSIREAAASALAGSVGLVSQLAGTVAQQLQQRAQVTGVVQGVDTAFGAFRTGEQVTLLRAIREATERTADAVNQGGGALT